MQHIFYCKSNKINIVLKEAFHRQKFKTGNQWSSFSPSLDIHLPIFAKPVDELDWIAYIDKDCVIDEDHACRRFIDD